MFNRKAKKPTAAEKARMQKLKALPCVACHIGYLGPHGAPQPNPTEVHHIIYGNKRRGHAYTIPLCGWHHRGEPTEFGAKVTEVYHGPSLALNSKKFHNAYGPDSFLLSETNELLEQYPC